MRKIFLHNSNSKPISIMKQPIRCLLAILLIVISVLSLAQDKYYSKSKKAIQKFETALYQYHLKSFDIAKKELAEAISIDDKFLDAFILSGEIANEENKKSLAVDYYSKAISIDANYNALMYLRRADLQKETGKYKEAMDDYGKFLLLEKKKKDYSDYVNLKIKQSNFALELMKNPVDFNPINLGSKINTPASEYWPSLTADDSMLVYTKSDRKINSQEDLYFSLKKNGEWLAANRIQEPINTLQSEGAQTISADGKTMVFTACLRKDGYGSCDLYISKKIGEIWSKPNNIGTPINSNYKETQPCLSSDGKTLYFISNRPGGKGKFDIWMSQLNESKQWEQPINLGDSINTPEDELAPFIHFNNTTLYYSSEGHLGMGGSDLFISRKNSNEDWSTSINLGYPINTYSNEESLIINAQGDFGFISSDMDGGYGQKDIYQFLIPPFLRPEKTIFIKGIVFDIKTNKPIPADIAISNYMDSNVLYSESDELTGEFLVSLMPKKNYAFNINKPGYMIFSENYSLPDSSIYIKIPLQPIEIGQLAVLRNIFFEFDSFELKKESYPELDKIIQFINQNKLSIEIQGHTDNIGTEAYNQKLSENRAKTVYDYLIKNGIAKKSLTYKGYGMSTPISDNITKEGQAANRRTTLKIVSKE